MKIKPLCLLALTSTITACSTIVFDNGPQAGISQDPVRQRHHGGGFFELVEFSPPKNLEQLCNGNNWRSITTEMSFLDGLIRQIVPMGIYSPRSTYTQCSNEGLPPGKTFGTVTDVTVDSHMPAKVTNSGSAPTYETTQQPAYEHNEEDDDDSDNRARSKSVGCSEKHRHLFFDCE